MNSVATTSFVVFRFLKTTYLLFATSFSFSVFDAQLWYLNFQHLGLQLDHRISPELRHDNQAIPLELFS
jgi:hypothetical protein